MKDPKTNEKRVNVYAYGCSLGANILGLYLGMGADHAAEYLDGALLYATPWSTKHGHKFFYENFFGLYQKAIGLVLNNLIKTK